MLISGNGLKNVAEILGGAESLQFSPINTPLVIVIVNIQGVSVMVPFQLLFLLRIFLCGPY